jgi:hypothetical protein
MLEGIPCVGREMVVRAAGGEPRVEGWLLDREDEIFRGVVGGRGEESEGT